jgi:hypothetical protein
MNSGGSGMVFCSHVNKLWILIAATLQLVQLATMGVIAIDGQ